MKKKIYAITGATGNIGGRIARELLAEGHEVRVLGRDAAKLEALTKLGAKAFGGQPENVDSLVQAFRGADAVFAMLPPHFGADDYRGYQNIVGDAQARAIVEAGVKKVVNLSSVGAQHSQGVGVVNGLHDQEARLNRLEAVDVLHLRPAFFLENSFHSVGLIKSAGINGSPLRPEVKLPMIATQDIAARAAEHLKKLSFTGKQVEELLGERDVSMPELTRTLGQAIGKPELPYVPFAYADAEKAMVQAGMSASAASNMVELYRAINEGRNVPVSARSRTSTTPTSVEAFAGAFEAVYRNA
jgi:uncharacterized protein YbjT (DUF2867 family)